jgi:hypothetical protein
MITGGNVYEQAGTFRLGLFFCPIDYQALTTATQLPILAPFDRLMSKAHDSVSENKALFSLQCVQHYISYHIHENHDRWDKDLLVKESRYADLIVLSGELFYADINLPQPNICLHEALQCTECPILVIPESYQPCEHLFFAFDASKESMFAMKQFSYLFPQLTDLPAEAVYIKDEHSDAIPDLEHLRRYARLHFESMGFSKLQFKASRYFATWIAEHKQVMLITGSYGRSSLSYLTKRSFAGQVVHDHKIPVFISHT